MPEKPTDHNPLTALEAARIAEEHWAYIVANGGGVNLKEIWPGWHKYGQMRSDCALCEYVTQASGTITAGLTTDPCKAFCPYAKRFGYTCVQSPSPFAHWGNPLVTYSKARLISAQKFLAQFTELRHYLEVQEFQSKLPVVDEDGWTMISSYPVGTGQDCRARVDKGVLVLETRVSTHPAPKDITGECTVELKKSHHSDGWYVLIRHGDKQLFVLGLDDKSAHLQLPRSKGYRVVKAKNATVSFNIMK